MERFGLLTFLVILGILVYLVPVFVAAARKNPNTLAIGMLNLFLGWTLLGWVAALVWACVGKPEASTGPKPVTTLDRLRDLDGRLFRNEITKEEFERERSQILR